MDQDRTTWGAQEYAAALNRATTPTDLFELVREVNQKWAAARGTASCVEGDPLRESRTSAASL